MDRQLPLFVQRIQQAGGTLVPFVVELPPGIEEIDFTEDVIAGGASQEATKRQSWTWLQDYVTGPLAVETMRSVMRRHRVSGFIVNDPRVDDPRLIAMASEGIVAVSLAPVCTKDSQGRLQIRDDIPYVANDYLEGFSSLINDLQDYGRERIGHLGFAPDQTIIPVRRRWAFTHHLPEAPHLEIPYEQSRDPERMDDIARWIKSEGIDAVVADSDDLALLAQRAGRSLGLSVSRDAKFGGSLLVTGIDDAPIRKLQNPGHRWPTISLDDDTYVDEVVDVLAQGRAVAESVRALQRTVPPLLVGAYCGGDPESRARIVRATRMRETGKSGPRREPT